SRWRIPPTSTVATCWVSGPISDIGHQEHRRRREAVGTSSAGRAGSLPSTVSSTAGPAPRTFLNHRERAMQLNVSRWPGLLAVTGAALVLCASCSSAADPAASPGNATTSAGQPTAAAPTVDSNIGSRDVALADPAVPRPDTKPCAVELIP